MRKILLVIDMQNDFIDGALGTKEAVAIVPKVVDEIKKYNKEIEAHSVRIAELMKAHEHGVLETTSDKFLIDFVTKTSNRTDTSLLKKKYPSVYQDVIKKTESRKLKVSLQPV